MTYYKNREKAASEFSDVETQKSKTPIKSLVHNILEHINGILIITNMTTEKKEHFYSLKLDKSQIHLIEKDISQVNTFCYDIKTNKLFINNQITLSKNNAPEVFTNFCSKINKIISDLKNRKAFAYEKQ
ncbi:MAG: hypothetical protein WC860_09600 [Candidatus Margulisiibacteriota bacterium]|jgi:hypothetical protein